MVRLTPNVSPFSLFAPTFVLLQALLSIGSYRHNNQCPHEVLAFAPTHNRFYSSAYISRISRTTVAFARRSPPSTSRETEKGSRTARDTKAARPGSARKQVEKGIKRKRISQANNPSTIDGNADPEEQRPTETLAGGPALIFAMARRMLVWDDESYVGQNDTYRDDDFGSGVPAPAAKSDTAASAKTASRAGILPRWHPHGGISDVNPSFRSTPPAMNSRGYAAAIRRNSRKRNKPASWRHALRTYYRMTSMEEEAGQEAPENMAGASTTNEDAPRIAARPRLAVRRSAPHYEGAIVACSKLGLWREAFRIYEEAAESKDGPSAQMAQASTGAARKHRRTVTDNMILGLVRAAVRGSKSLEMKSKDVEYRREPLDKVSNLLLNLEVRKKNVDETVVICDSFSMLDLARVPWSIAAIYCSQLHNNACCFQLISFLPTSKYFAFQYTEIAWDPSRCNARQPSGCRVSEARSPERSRRSYSGVLSRSENPCRDGENCTKC
mmetsp:Transcript_14115/g.28457  ORF Transcript_14115/g.28457 Transcript_14115/m.28457 type:complete len:497 (+) Transcript_14115:178-1668(+)